MNQFFQRFQSLVFFALALFLFLPFHFVQAISATPGVLVAKDLANNISVERIIQVSRGDTEKPLHFDVSLVEGSEEFIKLSSDSFVIPAGERNYDYSVFIEPKELANGKYTGIIDITSNPSKSNEQGAGSPVSVRTGVSIRIDFTVTDKEVISFNIKSTRFAPVEEEQPIPLLFSLENNGNVSIGPDKIKVFLTDRTDPDYVIEVSIGGGESLQAPPATIIEDVSALINEYIPVGKYDGKIEYYFRDELIARHDAPLEVFPKGSLAQDAKYISFETSDKILKPGTTLKMDARIQNTGEAAIEPVFFAEIYQGDQRIEFLREEKKFIPRGKDAVYTLLYDVVDEGDYRVDSYFEYGIDKTEVKTATFTVSLAAKDDVGAVKAGGKKLFFYFILFIIITIVILLFFWKRRKDDDDEDRNPLGEANQPPMNFGPQGNMNQMNMMPNAMGQGMGQPMKPQGRPMQGTMPQQVPQQFPQQMNGGMQQVPRPMPQVSGQLGFQPMNQVSPGYNPATNGMAESMRPQPMQSAQPMQGVMSPQINGGMQQNPTPMSPNQGQPMRPQVNSMPGQPMAQQQVPGSQPMSTAMPGMSGETMQTPMPNQMNPIENQPFGQTGQSDMPDQNRSPFVS